MTKRGRLVLALAAACYVAAWALGSKPLYPVAVGLALAPLLSLLWVGLSARPMRLDRRSGERTHVEGDHVSVRLDVIPTARVPPPSLVVVERIGRLGERSTVLDGLHGGYLLDALPRGRYVFEEARALIEDPFGLASARVPLEAPGALLVRPRPAAVERLFSDEGPTRAGGSRLAVRRPTGFDVHGVREWGEGESLRHVHWRSTAKRGRLMVKELEDAPRDEVAVLLDARAETVVGESFDVGARVAASILRAQVAQHRDARLYVNGARPESHPVRSLGGDWEAALDALAAAEPDGRAPVEALLRDDAPASKSLELVVITSAVTRGLVERLVQLARARRPASLVYVVPASFAEGARELPEPGLVRLGAAGVAVAVVRRGDDLATALSAARKQAHG